jgi:dihydrofolate reductase
MTLVTAQMTISLDGFYAGPKTDSPDWATSPEATGFFRITQWILGAMSWRERLGFEGGERNVDSDLVEESFEAAGAYVMGRRMADGGEIPWGEEPPFRAPVFVVTNRERETLQRKGGTSFTYVTDGLEAAVERARAAAGDKNVAIAGGGSLLGQVIAAGLLDVLDLHIVPVLMGDGMRLFDPSVLGLGVDEGVELVPTRVVEGHGVTHVRYEVQGRSPLVVSDERLAAAEA